MRHFPIALACVALLAAAAHAGDTRGEDPRPKPPRNALAGADCLNPSAARSWHYQGGNELLVDAGRRKYRITLWEICTELGQADTLGFRGDAVSGRVCGNAGERVVLKRSSCRIDRIELIDADTWRDAASRRRGSVSSGGPAR